MGVKHPLSTETTEYLYILSVTRNCDWPIPEILYYYKKARPFRKSLAIGEEDTGSCNACEMEINALANPVYDVERFGVHIAASPRHADAVVVTGPVSVNMESAMKDVFKTTPDPKLVIALGDWAINCGVFKGSYGVTVPVDRHVPVDVRIPGCPPRLSEILRALDDIRKP